MNRSLEIGQIFNTFTNVLICSSLFFSSFSPPLFPTCRISRFSSILRLAQMVYPRDSEEIIFPFGKQRL